MCCEILVNERAQRGQISIYSKIAFASSNTSPPPPAVQELDLHPGESGSVGAPTLTADLGPATN
jgi:hypothetical protein